MHDLKLAFKVAVAVPLAAFRFRLTGSEGHTGKYTSNFYHTLLQSLSEAAAFYLVMKLLSSLLCWIFTLNHQKQLMMGSTFIRSRKFIDSHLWVKPSRCHLVLHGILKHAVLYLSDTAMGHSKTLVELTVAAFLAQPYNSRWSLIHYELVRRIMIWKKCGTTGPDMCAGFAASESVCQLRQMLGCLVM